MEFDMRYGHHPQDVAGYDTEKLRKHFLAEKIFEAGKSRLVYTHVDRVIFGGICPTSQRLELSGGRELGTEGFLDRRELGLINVGNPGTVWLDGKAFPLAEGDGMYIGMGSHEVAFMSDSPDSPAKFYAVSSPAHRSCPTVRISRAMANPRRLGSPDSCNVRTIYQYVHPAVCESCQLVMGHTILEPASVWNTWPSHTHERRMEVYLYLGMKPETRVFHLMGQPKETRHLLVSNEDAVISPSWSIHSGVGTGSYSFIWAMAGENQNFDDMDGIEPGDLR